ncbi:MAG: hypothetical protein MJE68_01195, partial [Proteobacteria bacterium]|nr:hypothetical protein [Pseudomonadota bacterium]
QIVVLLDIATGTQKSLPVQTYETRTAFSSDSTTILIYSRLSDGIFKLFNVSDRTLKTHYTIDNIRQLWQPNEEWLKFSGTAFSKNGTFFAASYIKGTQTMRLWDILNDTLIATLTGPKRMYARQMEFSPDGTIFVAENLDGDAILWDVDTSTEIGILPHSGNLGSIAAFSPDGTTLLTYGGSPTFSQTLWDVKNATELHGIDTPIGVHAFSPDGTTLAVERIYPTHVLLHEVELWDVDTGTLKTIHTQTLIITYISFSPDGNTLATASYDGTVLLWELVPEHPPEICDADVNSPDGEVTIEDLVAVAAAIGQVAAAPAALQQPGAAHLTPEDVQHWLTLAEQAALTDATSVRGIRFLKQ